MNDPSAIHDQHTHTTMAAQRALSVSGMAVARVVIGIAAPLDGIRANVVVGRLDNGQP